ncbi:MAG TPA: hypothetical protein VEK07_07520 [Polyangiaceae bacterium]|nr:hypothetical protein [Polyangiaceae bacterium]
MNPTDLEQPGTAPHERSSGPSGGRRPRASADAERRKLEIARLRDVTRNLGAQIEQQVGKRPYLAIGAAAGIGFALGSVFGSRLGQVLLAVGLGYALKNALAGEIGVERIQAGLEKLTGEAGSG